MLKRSEAIVGFLDKFIAGMNIGVYAKVAKRGGKYVYKEASKWDKKRIKEDKKAARKMKFK
jgi:hypothetical protein